MELMPMGTCRASTATRNGDGFEDAVVSPGDSGGSMMRRVTDTEEKGTRDRFLTTESTLPAWVIALRYKHRCDLNKVFDGIKNKILERKSPGERPDRRYGAEQLKA